MWIINKTSKQIFLFVVANDFWNDGMMSSNTVDLNMTSEYIEFLFFLISE